MSPIGQNACNEGSGNGATPAARDAEPHSAGRWLVLGVFSDALQAGDAISSLAQENAAADALLLAGASGEIETPLSTGQLDAWVTIRRVSLAPTRSATKTIVRADLLSRLFSELMQTRDQREAASPRVGALFTRLVGHLERGATLLLVHAIDADHQVLVSRTMLASKCEVLLTHELARTGQCANMSGAADETCCLACCDGCCDDADPA